MNTRTTPSWRRPQGAPGCSAHANDELCRIIDADEEETPVVVSDLWPSGFDGSVPHRRAEQFFAPSELVRIDRDVGRGDRARPSHPASVAIDT